MAVPKSKVSRANRGSRNAHRRATQAALSIDVGTGETHQRHCITPSGFYRGKPVFSEKKGTEE